MAWPWRRAQPERDTGGGLPWSDMYPVGRASGARGLATAAAPPMRSVAASTSPVLLAPANPIRAGITVVNDSTAILYIGKGAASSSTNYAFALAAGQTWINDEPEPWLGTVWGVWAAANGAARITEQVVAP